MVYVRILYIYNYIHVYIYVKKLTHIINLTPSIDSRLWADHNSAKWPGIGQVAASFGLEKAWKITTNVGKNNNKPPIWEWFIPPIKIVIGVIFSPTLWRMVRISDTKYMGYAHRWFWTCPPNHQQQPREIQGGFNTWDETFSAPFRVKWAQDIPGLRIKLISMVHEAVHEAVGQLQLTCL